MNRLRFYSLIFFCIILLLSCESILDPRDFQTDKKIVLNCLFSPQQHWRLQLSISQNILGPDPEPSWLENAAISISGSDGSTVTNFDYIGNGLYQQVNAIPKAGVLYHIVVKHEKYEEIRASGGVPFPVEVAELVFIPDEYEGMEVVRIGFQGELSELADETSLILFNKVLKMFTGESGDTVTVESYALMIPDESASSLFENIIPGVNLQAKLFSPGRIMSNPIQILSFGGFRKSSDENLLKGISFLHLHSASPDYYEYLKSLEIYKWNAVENPTDVISPIEIHSNIQNGYGIFAGFNEVIFSNIF